MFHNRIKRFLTSMGFKDTELREFDIVEGEQESWIVQGFILTKMVEHDKKESYLVEKIIHIPGTYDDPPCEDYEQVGEIIDTFEEMIEVYMTALTKEVISDINYVEWEVEHYNEA